jgi:lipopolysaccharide transport system permease protein
MTTGGQRFRTDDGLAVSPSGEVARPEKPVALIRPPSRWIPLRLAELWKSRELVGFFSWRDVSVRYKQTVLGVAWVVIQPLVAVLIFSVFFGKLAGIPSQGVAYPVFAFCGLLGWQFFQYCVNNGGMSLVDNQDLIQKTYFTRLALPLAAVVAGLVDFLIAGVVLVCLMAVYGVAPPLQALTMPLFVVLMIGASLGIVLWLSALSVEYRDFRYVIPFMLQFWIFLTPIVYPVTLVPSHLQWLLGLNPMAGVVDGFRWALLGTSASFALIAVSTGVSAIVLLGGLLYFRKVEDRFADRI